MSKKILDVPKIKQLPGEYCGVACLCMIFSYYGFEITQEELTGFFNEPEEIEYSGVYPKEVVRVARKCDFNAQALRNLCLEDLVKSIDNKTPLIVRCKSHWDFYGNGTHFYIVKGYDLEKEKIFVNDPAHLNKSNFSYKEFLRLWRVNDILGNNYAIKIE
ncbi:C39 family peptidase [Candidatus Woesearchaeota archaeon]|nr:C39 family peptidase [Candidatus Woesearchaeota archaeon]